MRAAPRLLDTLVIELEEFPCCDPVDAEALSEDLLQAADFGAPVIVNCSGVRIFSASLIGALLSATRRMSAGSQGLVLCGLDNLAREVLDVTGLARYWRTCATVNEALVPSFEIYPKATDFDRLSIPSCNGC
jgi:anti-anti-sigma factor